MPILLKTQVDRTAKTPVTARRACVGSLCDFQDTVERVPTGSLKPDVAPTCGRTRNSTEVQRSGFGRKRRCSGMDETCRLRRGEGYVACIDEKQDKRMASKPTLFLVTTARGTGSFGDLRGRSKHSEKQPEGVAE